MRYTWILFMPFFAVGCVTQRPAAVQAPPPVLVAAVSPTKLVETRYDVRGYHEAANPAVRHEAHAVYRLTRVPLAASDELATVPRTAYAPASIAPLPASDELAAELSTQKKITGALRAMQTSMAETEQRMQEQYGMLVRQSAEALKLREQLEAERGRARAAPPAGVAVAPADTKTADVKW